MKTAILIGTMGVIVIAGVYTMVAYLTSLENTPPAIQQEKKGRAQYLIDTRVPAFNWDWLFDWDWQGKQD